jgi:hypothetical protein
VLGLIFDAISGTITAPFVVGSSNVISQPFETNNPAQGGSAVYNFQVTTAGDYAVQAIVNAPSQASNSFFVNIDSQPQDPFMVWHIPVTSGLETRTVSWQGNGTWDNPQIVPAVFTLTQGTHQLIVRGREANTQFQRFSILRLPSPPFGLRVTNRQ